MPASPKSVGERVRLESVGERANSFRFILLVKIEIDLVGASFDFRP